MQTEKIAARLEGRTQAIDVHGSKTMNKESDVACVAELAHSVFAAQPDRLLDTPADDTTYILT